jgi:hypothetical protein
MRNGRDTMDQAGRMINKKFLIFIAALVSLLVVAGLLNHSILLRAVVAKYKSTSQFAVLATDPRIRYEAPAKDNAIALQKILETSRQQVESVLGARFEKPVEAYVCASQDSFNDYVFLSKNVKGAVYWGKLFLSPGAFSQGEPSLAELTTHELTHYLFYTHLGEQAHVKNIPLWFREGIAVFVANGGAAYTKGKTIRDVMSSEEQQAYLSGATNYWFTSTDPRDAVAKNGMANWLLYRVGALFVHYLHDSQPAKFAQLTKLLLSGTEFSVALERSYGKKLELLLEEFARYLSSKP